MIFLWQNKMVLRLFDFEKLKTLLESSNRKVTKNCCDGCDTIFYGG